MLTQQLERQNSNINSVQRHFIFISAIAIYVWYLKANVNQADFLVFYSAAVAVLHHNSPYPALGSSAIYSGSSFVYPYLTAWLFIPLTIFDRNQAELLYVGVSLIALVAGLRLMGVKRHSHVLLFLLASATIVSWQIGTLNPLFVFGIGFAWRFRSRPVTLGVVIAILGFAKLFLLPIVFWLLLSKRYKAFAVACVSIITIGCASFVLSPLSIWNYLRLLSTLARHEGVVGYSTSALLRTVGLGVYPSDVIVLILAALVIFYFRRHSAADHDEKLLVGGFVISALVVTPIMWVSYLPLFGVALIFLLPVDLAVIIYFLCSWVIATPDKVGFLGVLIVLVAGILLGASEFLVVLRQIPLDRKNFLLRFRNIVTHEAAFRYVTIAVAILAAPAIFRPGKYPLVVTQFAILYLTPALLHFYRYKQVPIRDHSNQLHSSIGPKSGGMQVEKSTFISFD